MNTHRFFSRVWRINAIVILVAGALSCVMLVVASYMLVSDAFRQRHVTNVASVVRNEVSSEQTSLGKFEHIDGSVVLRAPLGVRQTYAIGVSSKEAGSTRNYFYFNPSTRATYWLRPKMDGLFLNSFALPEHEYGTEKKAATVYVHLSVDKDTDGDGRLTESDAKQISISSPDGKQYRILVTKAELLNDARLITPTRLLVLYTLDRNLKAVEIDLSSPDASPINYNLPISIK